MGAQGLIFVALSETSPQRFDRTLVMDILGKGAVDPVRFHCAYRDGSGGEIFGLDADEPTMPLDNLSFSRFGGRVMMERIYELADALEVFLVWTDFDADEPFACVTRADRVEKVSEAARPDLNVAVARDASRLNQLVKGSTFEENGWS